ncbi:hypothetical protein BDQ94DRAFT_143674 [Aspergillus welwitschiae]|uniref:Uncharacterized protein n=1 Tax=Aspergillus welwitschiae TaxID=1341132 RepID=A0A3F3Q1V7_9EURO|nr:hypothetical protein BDQ94DRAFT_143674 [Aspergillus welwitschiae]RDH33148.1 hypothetical protein BDQ94DRAFT_143674 [Aspergillus welwitschiae]
MCIFIPPLAVIISSIIFSLLIILSLFPHLRPPLHDFPDAHVYMNRKTTCKCATQVLECDEYYIEPFLSNYVSSFLLFSYLTSFSLNFTGPSHSLALRISKPTL